MVNLRIKNVYIVLLGDILLFSLANILSYCIRFEGNIPDRHIQIFLSSIFPIIIIKIFVFYFFNLYRGMWSYIGIVDLRNIFFASSSSSAIIILAILYFYRFEGFSRAVYIIDYLLTFIFIGGFRLAIRIFLNRGFDLRTLIRSSKNKKRNIIIIGAGNAGEQLYREIKSNRNLDYEIVGFIDDDPKKQGKLIHGVSVIGTTGDLKTIVDSKNSDIDEIIIAIPTASGKDIKRIIESCEDAHVKFRILPGLGELIDGKVSLKVAREISYNDILRREPMELDSEAISSFISNKKILITGAGGSIGSEVCRKVLRYNPELIIVYERNETNLFEITNELIYIFPQAKIVSVLGDILDKVKVNRVFEKHRPDIVFHAAAYKHVPIMEFEPIEAVRTNVIGTKTLADISQKYKIEKFIFISTDKAVRPVSVMGATKRIAEMYVYSLQKRHSCDFSIVRFGNVLGSSGSVVPIFIKQIEGGGPITVTHPEVTRYFMTISEAANLILQAAAIGMGREIFVLDMGDPIKITDLACDLIHLYGKTPEVDIEIKFTGLRPGEKLHEELLSANEDIIETNHSNIFLAKPEVIEEDLISKGVDDLNRIVSDGNTDDIVEKISDIVKEYKPFKYDRCKTD